MTKTNPKDMLSIEMLIEECGKSSTPNYQGCWQDRKYGIQFDCPYRNGDADIPSYKYNYANAKIDKVMKRTYECIRGRKSKKEINFLVPP